MRVATPGWLDVTGVRAANPGPMTLSGTNTWVVGRDPAWVVDPGPELPAHQAAVEREVRSRGGAGGVLLTHHHADHAEGAGALLARLGPVPLLGTTAGAGRLSDGKRVGPLTVLALPGHCEEHYGFVLESPVGRAVFTGDAVLGEGSVFVSAGMAAYLDGLRRLAGMMPRVLLPGHGPVVEEPKPHLERYIAHRREREAQVLAALRDGVRGEEALLDAVWGHKLAAGRRRAAAATLAAHLEKLTAEGRVPG